jgi:cytochrome c553
MSADSTSTRFGPFLRTVAGAGLALAALTATAQDAPPKAAICVACHGPGGNSEQALVPTLAGQTARYLYLQLRDFKAGQHYGYVVKQLTDFRARKRTNDAGSMTSVAKSLSDADIENLSQYIAGL